MTFLRVFKYHQQTSLPCSSKKVCFFFLPLFSHFCVLCPPSAITTVSWKASTCSERAPEHGATALRPTAATLMRRRRTWYLGRQTKMAWLRRWWTWATFPRRCLHATSTRPCSRWTQTGWGAGVEGGRLGSRFTALWLDVCLLNHRAECVIASRNESPVMSNKCMMSSAALAPDMHISMLPLFLVEFSLKVLQAFCHGWKLWDCKGEKNPSVLEAAIFSIHYHFQL